MKIKKKDIREIVDGDGSLIGKSGIPQTGPDIKSGSGKTSDYNMRVGRQPFRYDMMGRFGFTLLPFFEGDDKQNTTLIDNISKLLYSKYVDLLMKYNKNPKKLKVDYRKADELTETNDISYEIAKEILSMVEKYIEEQTEEKQTIVDEHISTETTDNIYSKEKPNDIIDKKLKRVVGLIDRLDIENRNKLIKLLELGYVEQ